MSNKLQSEFLIPCPTSTDVSSLHTDGDAGDAAGFQHGQLSSLQEPVEGLCGAPHLLQAGAACPATEELLRSLLHPGLKV